MAYKDLTFLLFAKDMNVKETFGRVSESADGMSRGVTGAMGGMGLAVAAAAIAGGAASVKLAADFQTATDRLVTDAGESQKSLGMVRDGILDISTQTGQSAETLAQGMYTVESAGYHGAAGLQVLHAASEGSVVGMANLGTVANALTTTMTDWNIPVKHSVGTMNALIAIVSRGKTTMEDLAGSIHSVAPTASALGINLAQTGGAIATMTAEGVSADQATENLNHAITSLASPSHVMSQEMAALGLNSTTVAAQLGKKGLTGTLDELVTAITHRMGPSGLVLQDAFTHSKLAAASAETMFNRLPPSAKNLAKSYEDGAISLGVYRTALKAQAPLVASQLKDWASQYNAANGFSTLLKSGGGAAQTFTSALEKATGGQTGLSVALHLTGDHMSAFKSNVDAVSAAEDKNGKHVTGWELKQKEMNQQLALASAAVGKFGVDIGSQFVPWVTKAASAVPGMINALEHVMSLAHDFNDKFPVWVTLQVVKFTDTLNHIVPGMGKIGADIINGFVGGLEGNIGKVEAAALNLAKAIPAPIRAFLGIHSPSKVAHEIGAFWGEGLGNGITGSVASVRAKAGQLATVVMDVFSGSTESKTLQTINAGTAQLEAEATKRASLAAQITATQKQLTKDLAAQSKAQNTSLKNDTLSQGDVTKMGSAGDMVAGLQDLVSKVGKFKTDLQKLAKMGLDPTTFGQIAAAGVAGGGYDAAESLVQNPIDVKEIAGLQKQLQTQANSLASYAGQYTYGATVAADRSKLATLKGAQKVETWKSQKTAQGMLNAIAAETHVHIHLSGNYAGSKDDLAKTVTQAIKDAVKRGQLPKNVLTAL